MKIISAIVDTIDSFIKPRYYKDEANILYWKERLVNTLFLYLVLFGAYIYWDSLLVALEREQWGIAVFTSFAYLFGILLTVYRKVRPDLKIQLMLWVGYALGTIVLIERGPMGGGFLWLFAFSALTGLFYGVRKSLYAVALNCLTIVAIGFALEADMLGWYWEIGSSYRGWTAVAMDFIYISVFVTVGLSLLLDALYKSLTKETSYRDDLVSEQKRLVNLNKLYAEEIEERRVIEDWLTHAQAVSKVGNWQLNCATRTLRGSAEAKRMFGFDDFETNIEFERFLVKLPVQDRIRIEDKTSELIAGGSSFEEDFKIILYGNVFDITSKWEAVRAADGKAISVSITIQDVTERYRTEEALRFSEDRYRQTMENSPNPIFTIDSEERIQSWNAASAELFGYDESIIGSPLNKILADDMAHYNFVKKIKQVFSQKAIFDVEAEFKTSYDKTLTFISRIYPLTSPDGMIRECVFSNTDITTRKLAENNMRKSEERMKFALEATSEGLWDWDLISDRVYFSHRYYEILGYERKEIGSTMNEWRKLLHPDDYKHVVNTLINGILKKQPTVNLEFRVKAKWGEWLWMLCRGKVVDWDVNGKPRRIVGTHADINERKRDEFLKQALFDIATAANAEPNLSALYDSIHRALSKALDTKNFFIALYDKEKDMISLPYLSDEINDFREFPAGKSLTAHVIKNGKPLLYKKADLENLERTGVVESIGKLSLVWLACPLIIGADTIGAVVLQSYTDENCYSEGDLKILEFVSSQIAVAVSRHKAGEALKESEERYRSYINGLPIGVYRTNETGDFIHANPALAELLGFHSVEELREYNIRFFKEPSFERGHPEYGRLAKEIYREEKLLVTKQGNEIWVRDTGRPFFDHETGQYYYDGIIEDITASKNAIDAMKISEERLKMALEASQDSVWDWNLRTNHMYFSPRFFDMLGYENTDIDGYYASWERLIHAEDLAQVRKALDDHLMGSTDGVELEFRMKKKEGEWVWVSCSGRVTQWESSGAPLRVVGTHSDISEKKWYEQKITNLNKELENRVFERTAQLEDALDELRFEIIERQKAEQKLRDASEELRRLYEREKELGELKSRFVAMISHEYRTPLTAILSATYILESFFKNGDEEGFASYIGRIQGTIKGMTGLLENALMVGRGEVKPLERVVERINAVELVREMIDEVKVTDKSFHKFVLKPENEKVEMLTDRNFLRHVMRNLLSNAIKFSPANSEVDVELKLAGDNVRIDVRDKGIGVPPEDLDTLFEPFNRGRNVGAISGAGLGLAIVKRYADALGATVSVRSEMSKGSTFTLEIPIEKKDTRRSPTPETEEAEAGIEA
ncbi:MAG: PAS domain S-box protein [Chloroflexota bacterium]